MHKGGALMNGKIKKEINLIFAIIFAAVIFYGCTNHTKITFHEDGSGSYEETFSLTKDIWNQFVGDDDSVILNYYRTLYPQAEITISDETIYDTDLKSLHLNMEFNDLSEYEQFSSMEENLRSTTFTSNYFTRAKIYMPLDEISDDAFGITDELEQLLASDEEMAQRLNAEIQNMDIRLTITFPYSVIDTNGSVQEDHKTVVWDIKQMDKMERLYALFHTSSSLTAPTFDGAVHGKAYNTGVSLKISSENLLEHVQVNDEITQSESLFLSAEGIYNITAVDINGNKKSIKFHIDKTKPSVSGVANGKTYQSARTIRFLDKGGSGIKNALLNGTQIKTGKKVSKKGTYHLIVTDKAGNQKITKFKIQ